MTSTCLVLNASYEPLPPVPTRRALRLVLAGKAELVAGDTACPIRGASIAVARPVVIRLHKYVRLTRKRRQVSNALLFARDGYRCAYCGRHERELKGRESLTRDHIVPQSKGGGNTWENCVTACDGCNRRKGARTLEELGWTLRVTPRPPTALLLQWTVRRLTPLQARYVRAWYGEEAVAMLQRADVRHAAAARGQSVA